MNIERGRLGALPYAAAGADGPPVVVLAGLSPRTGVSSDRFVHSVLAPVVSLAGTRRLIVLNRRAGLPADLTMGSLAAEHAEAIRGLPAPVDVLGMSTGGSIAQQLAADHPDVVRRLVLISTAARLGPVGRHLQNEVGAHLRAGRTRSAGSLAARGLAPRGLRSIARGVGWVIAPKVIDESAVPDLVATIAAEDGFDLASCTGPIQARTLIVAGGRDRFYGADRFHETEELISDSRLLLLERRGHLTVVRDRRALAHIAGFLT